MEGGYRLINNDKVKPEAIAKAAWAPLPGWREKPGSSWR
jgi:hypothetical protein